MALSYTAACKEHAPQPGVVLSEEWISKVKADPPGPETQIPPIQYQATNRYVLFDVEMKDPIYTSKPHNPINLLVDEKDENGETVTTFAGREYYWNNQLRKQALEEGLDKFVPQILYLVRPETAFTSCLHFLAKQLGGIDGFLRQRLFIASNGQLLDVTAVWTRIEMCRDFFAKTSLTFF